MPYDDIIGRIRLLFGVEDEGAEETVENIQSATQQAAGGVKSYENQMDSYLKKIDSYSEKALQAEVKRLNAQLDAIDQRMARLQGKGVVGDAGAQELASLKNVANQAYGQLDAVQAKLQQVRVAGTGAAGNKSGGIDLLVYNVRNLGYVTGGFIQGAQQMAEQLVLVKQSADAAAVGTKSMMAASGPYIAIATVLATGIMKVVAAEKERREEMAKAAEESRSTTASMEQEIADLTSAYNTYSIAAQGTQEYEQARQAIISSTPNLILGYDNEGKAILANNETIKSYIELQKSRLQNEKEFVLIAGRQTIEDYDKAADKARELSEHIETIRRIQNSPTSPSQYDPDLDIELKQYSDKLSGSKKDLLDLQSGVLAQQKIQFEQSLQQFTQYSAAQKTVLLNAFVQGQTEAAKDITKSSDQIQAAGEATANALMSNADELDRRVKESGTTAQKTIKTVQESLWSTSDIYTAVSNSIKAQLTENYQAESDKIKALRDQNKDAYDERMKQLKTEYDAKMQAIDDQLKAMDRTDEDVDIQRRIKALQEDILYEKDLLNKARREKELVALQAEYQKTLTRRELEDKKDALKEEQEAKEGALKDEYDAADKSLKLQDDTAKKAYENSIKYKNLEAATKWKIENESIDALLKLIKDRQPEFLAKGSALFGSLSAIGLDKMQAAVDALTIKMDINTAKTNLQNIERALAAGGAGQNMGTLITAANSLKLYINDKEATLSERTQAIQAGNYSIYGSMTK